MSQSGLSLERLQSFCRVAEAGGVTRAAKGDATKQSLYSRQVKELEEFFGAELIRRKGRALCLRLRGDDCHCIAREQLAALSDFKGECLSQPLEIRRWGRRKHYPLACVA
jgi:DNA-binding transcriptional LysR family regulator